MVRSVNGDPHSEPIAQALKLQLEAACHSFDWPDLDGVWDKLQEEIRELQHAPDAAGRQEELGDLLFMIVNLSRHLKVDPVAALCSANRKFERRFGFILKNSAALPAIGDRNRLEAMERLWVEAKRREHDVSSN